MVSEKDKLPIYESRRLLLPLETALDAVIEFDRQQAGSLWKSAVTESRLVTGGDQMMVVTTQAPGRGAEHRQFDLPTLAAAIIHYCVRARIPLPRQGRKSIDITPEGIAFSIESTVRLDRRHQSAPRRRGDDLPVG